MSESKTYSAISLKPKTNDSYEPNILVIQKHT